MLTLFGKIAEHLFGHKYYCVTIEEEFIQSNDACPMRSMSGYIFRTHEQAKTYYYQMKCARSRKSLEIISFRSKVYYEPFNTNYNVSI